MSELDSNQLVTSSLLVELNYFLETQHQLIDDYLTAYTAENTSLEDVANGIPYDIITATVATKKVCSVFPRAKQSTKSIVFCFLYDKPQSRLFGSNCSVLVDKAMASV